MPLLINTIYYHTGLCTNPVITCHWQYVPTNPFFPSANSDCMFVQHLFYLSTMHYTFPQYLHRRHNIQLPTSRSLLHHLQVLAEHILSLARSFTLRPTSPGHPPPSLPTVHPGTFPLTSPIVLSRPRNPRKSRSGPKYEKLSSYFSFFLFPVTTPTMNRGQKITVFFTMQLL